MVSMAKNAEPTLRCHVVPSVSLELASSLQALRIYKTRIILSGSLLCICSGKKDRGCSFFQCGDVGTFHLL